MKRVDTAAITDSARMPVKKSVIDYLQDAHKETTSEVIKGLVGAVNYATNAIYIVAGIINTSGTNYSGGSIFYNGELYLVDAVNLTSGTPYFSLINSVAEQVQYSDGSYHDTLISRKAELRVSGGTSIGNYSAAVVLENLVSLKEGATNNVKTSGAQTITGVKTFSASPIIPTPTTAYQSATKAYVDANTSPNRILYAGTKVIGDIDASGIINVDISFPTVGTDQYYVMGNIKGLRTTAHNQDCVTYNVYGYTATGFSFTAVSVSNTDVQNINFEFILFSK